MAYSYTDTDTEKKTIKCLALRFPSLALTHEEITRDNIPGVSPDGGEANHDAGIGRKGRGK